MLAGSTSNYAMSSFGADYRLDFVLCWDSSPALRSPTMTDEGQIRHGRRVPRSLKLH